MREQENLEMRWDIRSIAFIISHKVKAIREQNESLCSPVLCEKVASKVTDAQAGPARNYFSLTRCLLANNFGLDNPTSSSAPCYTFGLEWSFFETRDSQHTAHPNARLPRVLHEAWCQYLTQQPAHCIYWSHCVPYSTTDTTCLAHQAFTTLPRFQSSILW